MRVLLSTYGSRGDVEPMAGHAVQSRALPRAARVGRRAVRHGRRGGPGM
jgi:hypothetical protein